MFQAGHVKATWGTRCNKLLFMSSETDPVLPTVKLNVSEGRENLWDKTKKAFENVYKNHFQDYDWFVKADDDTYMIVENLRYLLKDFDPNQPLFFGQKLKLNGGKQTVFFSGGAGYVLSREALKRFAETGMRDPELCRQDPGGPEDVVFGCLENLGVETGDSRDQEGKRGSSSSCPSIISSPARPMPGTEAGSSTRRGRTSPAAATAPSPSTTSPPP